jgi:threonine dehydrogenase-like Zn-dependent dehydrogenase
MRCFICDYGSVVSDYHAALMNSSTAGNAVIIDPMTSKPTCNTCLHEAYETYAEMVMGDYDEGMEEMISAIEEWSEEIISLASDEEAALLQAVV